jgi:nitrous oxidase accessory protein
MLAPHRSSFASAAPRAVHRLVLAVLLALAVGTQTASAGTAPPVGTTLVVAAEGPYTSLEAALAVAQPGDTVEVRGGTYPGSIVVATPQLTLTGVDWPVIDGGGAGTVVTLAADGIVFSGFDVRGSGSEPDQDHSGVTLTASDIRVEANRLSDVLFGIYIAEADRAVVRGNTISSKVELEVGRKGDAIRVWYSQFVTLEGNTVTGARDVVAWYATDLVLRANTIEHGRYGIHLMYCDRALIERNHFEHNSVGVYAMYSRGVVLRENLLRGQRGPSGYALGFKDVDDVSAAGNVLVDNRVGIFLDGTPFTPLGTSRFEHNVLAFNDTGVSLLPAVQGNVFTANTLWENVEQVALLGGGTAGANDWTGNYWSDYAGFDANGDQAGDAPYRSERLFDSLIDREPLLRSLLYSPAVQTLELAAAAFPVVRPQPKLVDPAPRMAPAALPAWAVPPVRGRASLVLAAFGLLAGCGLCVLLGINRGERGMPPSIKFKLPVATPASTPSASPGAQATVVVAGVSKRYGRLQALTDISFEAQPGEALALWGANGAGKSTLLKAMLGLVEYDGRITLGGYDARRSGKLARRSLGYVPQEALFYDLSVQATLTFYAQLKQAGTARIPALLDRLGLAPHARQAVPALSGGLKQRLALAIALLSDPAVLLLDEPTANLDAQAQREYLALLVALRTEEHKTILFASHRLEEVEAVANRVLLLEQGRLVATLTPLELLARLLPQVELTLWVPAAQRQDALSTLTRGGWAAHSNGRGTVVVQVRSEDKLQPLQALQAQGIHIDNFEMTRGAAWN